MLVIIDSFCLTYILEEKDASSPGDMSTTRFVFVVHTKRREAIDNEVTFYVHWQSNRRDDHHRLFFDGERERDLSRRKHR